MDSELPCALQGRTWEKIENGAVKLAQHKDKGIMLVAAHACYIGNEIYRLSIQQSEEKITIYDQETDVPDELKNYAFSVLDKQVAPADVCALIFAPNEPSKGESVNAVVVDSRARTRKRTSTSSPSSPRATLRLAKRFSSATATASGATMTTPTPNSAKPTSQACS